MLPHPVAAWSIALTLATTGYVPPSKEGLFTLGDVQALPAFRQTSFRALHAYEEWRGWLLF